MAERDELAIFRQLVAGLFAEFARGDLFDRFPRAAGVNAPGYRINLAGWHFPDRFSDWDAFLVNENDFAVVRHRRNNDGRFAMHDRPCARLAARWCLHSIGRNFQMCIGEVLFAGNRFPPSLFHAESVEAASDAGNRVVTQTILGLSDLGNRFGN